MEISSRHAQIQTEISALEIQIKEARNKINALRAEERELTKDEASEASYRALCKCAENLNITKPRSTKFSHWADTNRSFMTLHDEKHLLIEGDTETRRGLVVLTIRIRPDHYSTPHLKRTKSFATLEDAYEGIVKLAHKTLQEAVIAATKDREN